MAGVIQGGGEGGLPLTQPHPLVMTQEAMLVIMFSQLVIYSYSLNRRSLLICYGDYFLRFWKATCPFFIRKYFSQFFFIFGKNIHKIVKAAICGLGMTP